MKILIVTHFAWGKDAGAAKVNYELAQAWRDIGHQVDYFDLTKAAEMLKITPGAFSTVWFRWIAAFYVRKYGRNYDIVYAEHGNLAVSKRTLKFDGVLVTQSSGLWHFYHEFEMAQIHLWGPLRRGSFAGNILRWFYQSLNHPLFLVDQSFRHADLVVMNNSDEGQFGREKLGLGDKVIVRGNGLTDAIAKIFAKRALDSETRLKNQVVVFIGGWTERKGAREWPEIVDRILKIVPQTRFRFLGTGIDAITIEDSFKPEDRKCLEIVPDYESEQLPDLIADATIGAFPSHLEGFGIAVIEYLAAGLPVVAWDAPGPRDILESSSFEPNIPVGDSAGIAEKIAAYLQLNIDTYKQLSTEALAISQNYRWHDQGKQLADVFERTMNG